MLRSVKNLEGLSIAATDGIIGKVKDFYFDDDAWVIRYLVVATSAWLDCREVLVSPISLGQPDWGGSILPASISKQQIKNSPSIDTDKPISRQYEKSYLGHYGYAYYWGGVNHWGENYYPGNALTGLGGQDYDGYRGYLKSPSADHGDAHLRSCNAVEGYHICATDGEVGHVDGFVVDDLTWSVRYLIVNTSNWWMGHRVLLSPEWIRQVSWPESSVDFSLNRQTIKDAPIYDEGAPFHRDAEMKTYSHYGRKIYWHHKHERAA
jgi:sporulation protein YlmC with PRC-barrel domain